MDLTNTIVPKSDQLNSDDLIAGPRTFTVTEVRVKSTTEQPVDIHLSESPGKPFRNPDPTDRFDLSVMQKDKAETRVFALSSDTLQEFFAKNMRTKFRHHRIAARKLFVCFSQSNLHNCVLQQLLHSEERRAP